MPYTRVLKYTLPFLRGEDVLELQRRLRRLSFAEAGEVDGIFGAMTDKAVRNYQQQHNLKVDGVVGPVTWSKLFADFTNPAQEKISQVIQGLKESHSVYGGVSWLLRTDGLSIEGGKPEDTGGEPKTVARIWQEYGDSISRWSEKFGVPAELIVATICTETNGNAKAIREEPGYISDEATPDKVSPGITQTLISTAREVLANDSIDRDWLLNADNAIRAGTAYIARQWKKTDFDPPKVACAYNAGGVYKNEGEKNRWKMRQYPINSGEHADRFVHWFNDCVRYFDSIEKVPEVSFYSALKS